jgi:GNAT superfamily N-acetyltransferase
VGLTVKKVTNKKRFIGDGHISFIRPLFSTFAHSMEHILDNPIYNALISGNSHLSEGLGEVRYFPRDISPFAGLKNFDENSFTQLASMLPPKTVVVMITAMDFVIPTPWQIIHQSIILQMTGENAVAPSVAPDTIIPLDVQHVPQMLELTKLTNPGPFLLRTIEFGNYTGIFDGERLIAMAGNRLHAGRHKEISAVCTHPDYTGKGYGKLLLLYHTQQIIQQGEIPFLHVRTDNKTAIRLYSTCGFVKRSDMHLNVIQR